MRDTIADIFDGFPMRFRRGRRSKSHLAKTCPGSRVNLDWGQKRGDMAPLLSNVFKLKLTNGHFFDREGENSQILREICTSHSDPSLLLCEPRCSPVLSVVRRVRGSRVSGQRDPEGFVSLRCCCHGTRASVWNSPSRFRPEAELSSGRREEKRRGLAFDLRREAAVGSSCIPARRVWPRSAPLVQAAQRKE